LSSPFQQQMSELAAEREALFGFSDAETAAWSRAGGGDR
jgi:hypothetical protein